MADTTSGSTQSPKDQEMAKKLMEELKSSGIDDKVLQKAADAVDLAPDQPAAAPESSPDGKVPEQTLALEEPPAAESAETETAATVDAENAADPDPAAPEAEATPPEDTPAVAPSPAPPQEPTSNEDPEEEILEEELEKEEKAETYFTLKVNRDIILLIALFIIILGLAAYAITKR